MDYEQFKRFAAHAGGSYQPVLGDARVYETPGGNRAQIGNGRYWVDIPTELPAMVVNAERLAAALLACKGTPKVSVTGSFVTVSSGRARARLQVSEADYPLTEPDPPDTIDLTGVIHVLKLLEPFVATDASRPWATSVCLSGPFAYATNNATVTRHPLPDPVEPPVNIPINVLQAIIERGDATSFGHTDRSVTFYYGDGSWVRTLLVAGEWPTKTVDSLLDGLDDSDWEPIHHDLEDMLSAATRLSPERNPLIEFNAAGLMLTDESFVAEGLEPLPDHGRVSARMAAMVFGTATHVQWHRPRSDAHAFLFERLVGVLGGVR